MLHWRFGFWRPMQRKPPAAESITSNNNKIIEKDRLNYHLTTMYFSFQTLYPFQGNAAAHQLSFGAGAWIVVTDPSKTNVNGWAFGTLANNNNNNNNNEEDDQRRQRNVIMGWFPLNYVVSRQHPQSPQQPALTTRTSAAVGLPCATTSGATTVETTQETAGGGFRGSWHGSSPQSPGDSRQSSDNHAASSLSDSYISNHGSSVTAGLANNNNNTTAGSSFKTGVVTTSNKENDNNDSTRMTMTMTMPMTMTTQQERNNIVSGGRLLPGGEIDTKTQQISKNSGGISTTTIATTERNSSGFMSWIPRRKTERTNDSNDDC
jgi:hypothetical protein